MVLHDQISKTYSRSSVFLLKITDTLKIKKGVFSMNVQPKINQAHIVVQPY